MRYAIRPAASIRQQSTHNGNIHHGGTTLRLMLPPCHAMLLAIRLMPMALFSLFMLRLRVLAPLDAATTPPLLPYVSRLSFRLRVLRGAADAMFWRL